MPKYQNKDISHVLDIYWSLKGLQEGEDSEHCSFAYNPKYTQSASFFKKRNVYLSNLQKNVIQEQLDVNLNSERGATAHSCTLIEVYLQSEYTDINH